MAKSADLTPTDFIQKTVGNLLYIYYFYVDRFKLKPRDLEDLVDGLLYIDANNFLQKKAAEKK